MSVSLLMSKYTIIIIKQHGISQLLHHPQVQCYLSIALNFAAHATVQINATDLNNRPLAKKNFQTSQPVNNLTITVNALITFYNQHSNLQ